MTTSIKSQPPVDGALANTPVTLVSGDHALRRFRSLSEAGAYLRRTGAVDLRVI